MPRRSTVEVVHHCVAGVWLSVLAELLIALDVPHQIQTGLLTCLHMLGSAVCLR